MKKVVELEEKDVQYLCAICRQPEAYCTRGGRHTFESSPMRYGIMIQDKVVSVHHSEAEARATACRL